MPAISALGGLLGTNFFDEITTADLRDNANTAYAGRGTLTRLANYAEAVLSDRAMKGAKLFVRYSRYGEVYVGFDDEPVPRGRLSAYDDRYQVASIHINNARYGSGDPDCYMAKSSDLTRAAKRAVKELRSGPETVHRLLDDYRRAFVGKAAEERRVADRNLTVTYNAITGGLGLVQNRPAAAIFSAVAEGSLHNIPVDIVEKCKEFMAAWNEMKKASAEKFDAYEVFSYQGRTFVYKLEANNQAVQRDMAPPIQEKMAVLAMLANEHYVHEVGVKYSDKLCYVLVPPAEGAA